MGVRLANLTGLGLGYLVLRQKMRWLFHFLVSIALILLATATKAAQHPLLWMMIAVIWVGWMVLDIEKLARSENNSLARLERKSLLLVLCVSFVLVIEFGGYYIYRREAQNLFTNGYSAYMDSDYQQAHADFSKLVTDYQLTLDTNIPIAENKLKECELLLKAQQAVEEGDLEKTLYYYQIYLEQYGIFSKVNEAEQQIAEAKLILGNVDFASGNYERALKYYHEAISQIDKGTLADNINEKISQLHMEWAVDMRDEGDYHSAIDKFELILENYNFTLIGDDVAIGIAETYFAWGMDLYQQGEFEGALEKINIVQNDYFYLDLVQPESFVMADIYSDWGEVLAEEGMFSQAIEKYEIILKYYPDPSSRDWILQKISILSERVEDTETENSD